MAAKASSFDKLKSILLCTCYTVPFLVCNIHFTDSKEKVEETEIQVNFQDIVWWMDRKCIRISSERLKVAE